MTSDYASAIMQMPLFSGFTPVGAQRLLDQGTVKEHARGDRLCNEGDPADCALLILSGKLRVYVERGGVEFVLSDFGPGTILGDIAVLCGTPRATSARALEPSAVLYWTAQEFRSLLLGDVFLSQRILSTSLRFLIEHEKSLIDALTGGNHA
jgi:CRP/FNR family transcriptional regulator, cyclic AMP receptor protein